MRDLNVSKFLETVLEVRRLKTVIENASDEQRSGEVVQEVNNHLQDAFREMAMATGFIGAELASMAADRMVQRLGNAEDAVMLVEVRNAAEDIESRLSDECSLISFLVLNRHQRGLFQPANQVVGWDINRLFPDAARELEEGAKCLALQRPTAAVFHAMRMLEVGIKKLSELLGIDDPVKPAEKNWGKILDKIKAAIDSKYPKSQRLPNSDGAKFEGLYASLDAVKNPWRNGTMHVESFYSDSEALHIANCVVFFMQKLGEYIDPGEVTPSYQETDTGAALGQEPG